MLRKEYFHKFKTSFNYFCFFYCVCLYVKKLLFSVNRAQKQLSAVAAWENSKKAALEAQLRKIEVLFVASLSLTMFLGNP